MLRMFAAFKKTPKTHSAEDKKPESSQEKPDLPIEIWLSIFSYVNKDDLYNLSLVNSFFSSIASDDELWMPIAKQHLPSLNWRHSEQSVKEQLKTAVIAQKEAKSKKYLSEQKAKKTKSEFKTIDSSLSIQTSNTIENVGFGAYNILPIFTYGAGKMAMAESRGDYFNGLENTIGVLLLPWAVIVDVVKAPVMVAYTGVNLVRLAVTAPVNFFFGGRDGKKEEDELYLTMRYSLFATIEGLDRLGLEDDKSLAAMSQEGHLQPLMTMVCFLIAYNSMSQGKNTLLLNETKVTEKTCPRRFLPVFERIIQLRDRMKSNLIDCSIDNMSKLAVEWVPTIWAALKSDENVSIKNDQVQAIVSELKDLTDLLIKNGIDEGASERIMKHLAS